MGAVDLLTTENSVSIAIVKSWRRVHYFPLINLSLITVGRRRCTTIFQSYVERTVISENRFIANVITWKLNCTWKPLFVTRDFYVLKIFLFDSTCYYERPPSDIRQAWETAIGKIHSWIKVRGFQSICDLNEKKRVVGRLSAWRMEHLNNLDGQKKFNAVVEQASFREQTRELLSEIGEE